MQGSLDAAAVRRWCGEALSALRRHQGEIDGLNVFPVPDGDTGTNLVLTLQSAVHALAADAADGSRPGVLDHPANHLPHDPAADDAPAPALRRMARGALLGARGNSGVIVAQLLGGVADALGAATAPSGTDGTYGTDGADSTMGTGAAGGRALAAALHAGAEAGAAAVGVPVEGTIVTVAQAAAAAATAVDSDDLVEVAAAAAAGAAIALDRTPTQLAALAKAGVVDAGGRGLVVLLDALHAVARGEPAGSASPPAAGPVPTAPVPTVSTATPVTVAAAATTVRPDPADSAHHAYDGFAYEVQYLIDADRHAVADLRRRLAALGDSLVVVGDDPPAGAPGSAASGTWNVHVHVDDVGAAIEAGIEVGRPHRIAVTRFADAPRSPRHEPVAAALRLRESAGAPGPLVAEPLDPEARAVVAVAAGPGLADLFTAAGATVVAPAPSPAELLAAVAATGAGRVVVLPNQRAALSVARLVADEARGTGRTVTVLHTRSPVQALAALAVTDPARPFADDVVAMAEAAAATRRGHLTFAARDALTVAGTCRAGDVLGLVDGEVAVIGAEVEAVAAELLDRMLAGGGELVTLVTGAAAPPRLADRVGAHLAARWPFVGSQSFFGGQPGRPLLLGVE